MKLGLSIQTSTSDPDDLPMTNVPCVHHKQYYFHKFDPIGICIFRTLYQFPAVPGRFILGALEGSRDSADSPIFEA